MKTFKDIVDTFQAGCAQHAAVNTFYYGTIDKLDSTSQNVAYPYVFLRPLTSVGLVQNPNGQSANRSLSFEMYVLDIPKLTESDYLQVMSDSEVIIYDLISYFNLGASQRNNWINLTTITPVNEAFNDRVYGWVAEINYQEMAILDYCLFPTR